MRMKNVTMKQAAKVPDERTDLRTLRRIKKAWTGDLPFATANHLIKRGKAAETPVVAKAKATKEKAGKKVGTPGVKKSKKSREG